MDESINWTLIESEYRVGIKSVNLIASENNITEGAIRKRAKRDGWIRNLGMQIKAKAEELVRTEAVRTEVRGTNVPENEIVEANANLAKDVLMRHRSDIKRLRDVLVRQIDEIDYSSTDGLDLPKRIKAVKDLGETLKNIIGLEREAYGIDSRFGTDEQNKPEVYDQMETARRVAFVLARAVHTGGDNLEAS